MVKVILQILTFNRLQYTRESLESLLGNPYPFHLIIHDNGSTEKGMIDYLRSMKKKEKRIVDLILSSENLGLTIPTNNFWRSYKEGYPYLGKIDNDTVIPEDAVERMVDIMDHCPDVGICHGFHWLDESYSRKRLIDVNGRILLRTKWGGGCFYLMRSAIVHRCGYIPTRYGKMGGWTEYQMKVRRRGHKIVYAYPLIKVKHLGNILSGRNEETGDYFDYYSRIKKIRRMKN